MDAQCYPDFAGEKYPQCPYRAEAGQHCQDSADPFMYIHEQDHDKRCHLYNPPLNLS